MELDEKDLKRMAIIAIGLVLAVLAFFLLKPILLSIIGGLLLAYVLYPVHLKVLKYIRSTNASAGIVSLIVVLLIILPLWFLVPIMIQQSFELFTTIQSLDIGQLVHNILPGVSDVFIAKITVSFNTFVNNFASDVLNSLVDFILNFPIWLLRAFLIAFVFFFALRDGDKLKLFIAELSPLTKSQEKIVVEKFRGIADTLIYGQVIVGIVQGITAGLGFLIFGVPNALVLTVLATVFAVIPFIGPGIVWVPVAIFLFAQGNTSVGFGFLAYNLIIVSVIDNILRTYIISKRSKIHPVVIFIGMIGGLFLFGLLGLIIGPLVLTYLLVFLRAYKEKTLVAVFKEQGTQS